MKCLAYDTSFSDCRIVIADVVGKEVQILDQEFLTGEQSQVQEIVVEFERLLGQNSLGYIDLDCLCLTTGPGNFTSVRVGLSFAQALSLSFPKLKILGVNSYIAMILQYFICKPADQTIENNFLLIIAMSDQKSYCAVYSRDMQEIKDMGFIGNDDIINELEQDSYSVIYLKRHIPANQKYLDILKEHEDIIEWFELGYLDINLIIKSLFLQDKFFRLSLLFNNS